MNEATVQISAEVTPNPNTLKFNVNKTLINAGSKNFTSKEQARGAGLVESLFEIPSIIGVMVGPSFITITKKPDAGWPDMVAQVTEMLRSGLQGTEPLFAASAPSSDHASGSADDAPIIEKIKEILDTEIRPAVNMDGGDITFEGYYEGVVTLHLQGSCSHCPSSIMTLKMGVENRLKALIPEVKEVVQV